MVVAVSGMVVVGIVVSGTLTLVVEAMLLVVAGIVVCGATVVETGSVV